MEYVKPEDVQWFIEAGKLGVIAYGVLSVVVGILVLAIFGVVGYKIIKELRRNDMW